MAITFKELFGTNILRDYSLLIGGCFIFAFGGVALVEPYGFAPGGTYGISMVFHHLWGWSTEVSAFCMDVPLFLIGLVIIGKQFGIKTAICSVIIPLFMRLIHNVYGFDSLIEPGVSGIENFTTQLPAALLGGLVYGVGLGMIFLANATSGGSDVISMILNKYTGVPIGTLVIIVDGLITLSTVVAFGNWRLPMYSWIVIGVEGLVINMVVSPKLMLSKVRRLAGICKR